MNNSNSKKGDQLENLIIPSDREMEKAWNNFEDYKDEYPNPDLNSVWKNVNDKLGQKQKITIPIHKRLLRYAAAIIALALVGGGLFYSVNKINQRLNYITYNSPSGIRSKINLTDGSTIWLQPNSQIKYPKKFSASSREIYFMGQAYFDINKNPQKPFIIHANNVDITVLGTQFYVKANTAKDIIETGLISGKVKVGNSVFEEYMNPNDVFLYSKKSNKIVNKGTLSDNNFEWNNGSLVFDNCKLSTVLKDISDWYDMELDLKASLNTNVTVTVREESIYEIMEILKIVAPFDYKIEKRNLIVFED